MFGLFSKKKNDLGEIDFSSIQTDMHSHLLPGIDDGAPNVSASLKLIKGLKNLGYSKIITTPHILWDMYKNTPEIIDEKLQLIQEALIEHEIDMEINAAAEYFLDEHTAALIRKKQPLLTVKDNMVLVEFSVMHMSINMKEMIFDLMMAGYQPILAHPERYTYLNQNRDVFDDLKTNGCLFQLNLLSTGGGYGKTTVELAKYLLQNNFYSFVGTDMHHAGHLERLKTLKPLPELEKLLNSPQFLNPKL
jgi:tyrosine-protein phosphatase YwqE